MSGLTEKIELLKTIKSFWDISESISITGLSLLDIAETKGRIHIKFRCPDEHFPAFGFNVEFQVTKEFFEKELRTLLETENV